MEPRRNVIYRHPLISLDVSVIGCQEAFRYEFSLRSFKFNPWRGLQLLLQKEQSNLAEAVPISSLKRGVIALWRPC